MLFEYWEAASKPQAWHNEAGNTISVLVKVIYSLLGLGLLSSGIERNTSRILPGKQNAYKSQLGQVLFLIFPIVLNSDPGSGGLYPS
jgi:hypothetical protein